MLICEWLKKKPLSHDHVRNVAFQIQGPVKDVERDESERKENARGLVDLADVVEVLEAAVHLLLELVRVVSPNAVQELDAAVLARRQRLPPGRSGSARESRVAVNRAPSRRQIVVVSPVGGINVLLQRNTNNCLLTTSGDDEDDLDVCFTGKGQSIRPCSTPSCA